MTFSEIFNSVFIDFIIIIVLIIGISRFRTPPGARVGNFTTAFALLCSFLIVLIRHDIHDPTAIVVSLVIGSVAGYILAILVNMIQIPAMVAFQHGAGGVAAFLISFVELTAVNTGFSLMNEISGILGLVIGAATFSGSMIASGKLSNKLRQTPQVLRFHSLIALMILLTLIAVAIISLFITGSIRTFSLIAMILLSMSFGVIIAIRIGGADMPVLISFLNATAGLAAAFCGMIIENKLLIACGATVTASGSILTHVMCKSMNRSVLRIFIPKKITPVKKTIDGSASSQADSDVDKKTSESEVESDFTALAAKIALAAEKVIIVPGYGMAIAQAQTTVADLAKHLIEMGKDVKFAIHPVAGRMPGHMNVLLAEADIEYELLYEMDNINDEFKEADMVLVVGACDVVNPSAINVEGTPISGMPILCAYEAKNIICCNYDEKPGYSGVQNDLYEMDKTILICGDAKETVKCLNERISVSETGDPAGSPEEAVLPTIEKAVDLLKKAGSLIVVPGYGMALGQAQFKVVELVSMMENAGVSVKFAIHPVAGRMPGHMNVLLAEAEVDYDKLKEMDEINFDFKDTDVVLVVGACDVVNPSAINVEGTPISGMPILAVHEARNIIICNYDGKPGYSGVENPIYKDPRTVCVFGDAKETISYMVSNMQ
ncbi:MAG TPA: NAD(P)(+) transhydrogenase (Re/Si-specific) subunit beta [bacterium]|nr:NAD(P)(+) transhydrogenase (Re/Si-specific) subunit beta [bacterium]